jgi:hypothetical protein
MPLSNFTHLNFSSLLYLQPLEQKKSPSLSRTQKSLRSYSPSQNNFMLILAILILNLPLNFTVVMMQEQKQSLQT